MPVQKLEATSGAHSIAPAWSDVTALDGSAHRIRLGGTFDPAWLARLCRGLAGQRISIERAHAMRAPNRAWNAELHVVCLPGAPAPERSTVLQLLVPETPAPGPLELDRYELTAGTAHGGTLQLTIEAPDGLGLLGSLLAQLARLKLYPVEMHIETRAGRAEDSLWLSAEHGRPTLEQQEALERILVAALRTSAA